MNSNSFFVKGFFFLCAALISFTTFARNYGFYGQAEIGANFAQIGKTQNLNWPSPPFPAGLQTRFVNKTNTDTALNLGIQAGLAFPLTPQVLLETGLGINTTTAHMSNGQIMIVPTTGQSLHGFNYKYKMQSTRAMLKGRLFYIVKPRIAPFVDLGVGYTNITTSKFSTTPLPGWGSFSFSPFGNKNTTNFAWEIGAGINYQITRMLGAIIGYRYVDLGPATLKATPFLVGSLKTGDTSTHDVYLAIHLVY